MTNVVFIHGLWISHTAWQPWIERFAAQGHHAVAPAWPGEHEGVQDTRDNAGDQAGIGIDELTEYFAELLERFDTQPVVIGHSFGGLIAQKLLGQNKVAAAIAIDPAPIKGVKPLPLAQLRSALPVLGNPLNRGRAKGLTETQWRYGFGNALPSPNRTPCGRNGRFRHRASHCSRQPRRTSRPIRLRRWTRPTAPGDRC